jgi:predicted nucleotidyltransferase
MHKSALRLVREQLKKHRFGRLEFLAFIGTRPWGIAREFVDYDYRGVYSSKEEKTYEAFINQIYINNFAKDITLVSLERFVKNIFEGDIHSLICLNSPIIYASKDFLEFRKWVNSHPSKKIYYSCQPRKGYFNRKDYLYGFFFIGNGIALFEKKKVIANLPELNKKILKIPAIDKLIEEEKKGAPFEKEEVCKKIILKLKNRLEKAKERSNLPEVIDKEKFSKLKILKRIVYNFWLEEGFKQRYQKERKELEEK